MTNKTTPWKDLIAQTPEAEFDSRLIEKKIDDGFTKAEDLKKYVENLSPETEFDIVDVEASEKASSDEASSQ